MLKYWLAACITLQAHSSVKILVDCFLKFVLKLDK